METFEERYAAAEVGPGASWLLVIIALAEDLVAQPGPVAIETAKLMRQGGFNSDGAFRRAREKLARTGWLEFRKGPGRVITYRTRIPEYSYE